MIEYANINQRKRLLQGLGQSLIRPARFRHTGGMVVRKIHFSDFNGQERTRCKQIYLINLTVIGN
jgi:hypothetical protein